MNGILVVNKPMNMTSFDVIAILRKAVGIKKIGHTGTLDPDATGVLPVCIGKATGAVEYLIDKDKSYRVVLKLGIETDTGDASGTVLRTMEVNSTEDGIRKAVMSFKGKIKQIPPMYSALKVGGEKLCNLARKGITIEREPRDIEIFDINILDVANDTCSFEVSCSKGTYIRTLCEDIGKKLGIVGHMAALCRVQAGKFGIDEALTIEDIKIKASLGVLEDKLVKVDQALEIFEPIRLNDAEAKGFLNGVFINLDGKSYKKENCDFLYRIYHGAAKLQTGFRIQDSGFRSLAALSDCNELDDKSSDSEYGDLFLGIGSIIIREGRLLLRSRKLFV